MISITNIANVNKCTIDSNTVIVGDVNKPHWHQWINHPDIK